MLTYAHVCGGGARQLVESQIVRPVCVCLDVFWRMLTHADVCGCGCGAGQLVESQIVGLLGVGSPEEAKEVLAGINQGLAQGSLKPLAGIYIYIYIYIYIS
jgi:hypothetical protein